MSENISYDPEKKRILIKRSTFMKIQLTLSLALLMTIWYVSYNLTKDLDDFGDGLDKLSSKLDELDEGIQWLKNQVALVKLFRAEAAKLAPLIHAEEKLIKLANAQTYHHLKEKGINRYIQHNDTLYVQEVILPDGLKQNALLVQRGGYLTFSERKIITTDDSEQILSSAQLMRNTNYNDVEDYYTRKSESVTDSVRKEKSINVIYTPEKNMKYIRYWTNIFRN